MEQRAGNMDGLNGAGKQLFLRYSHGCRMYCEDKGMISDSDRKALDSGDPPYEVLRRVFYVAIPSLENIARRMTEEKGRGFGVFDLEVLREFYSGEHNERKMREGQLACLSFPARVAKVDGSKSGNRHRCLVELEPVKGSFWLELELETEPELGLGLEPEPSQGLHGLLVLKGLKAGLKAGDWVVVHRADIVEKIPEEFALDMKARLERLGLDKTYKFPKVAIKYLKRLKGLKEPRSTDSYGCQQADQGASDEGKDEAPADKGRQKERPDKGPGEAYA